LQYQYAFHLEQGENVTKLAFYFDPLCPWAWLTSLWVREIREPAGLEVDWKFFSLTAINELDQDRNGPLRITAQARREGGNEAVDRAYLALGRMNHERRQRFETLDELRTFASEALREVDLDPKMVDRALDDPTTVEDVLTEHRAAVEQYDAFGVPWIVLEDGTKGFFGPVIGERLRGKEALELWEHFTYASSRPYLYELKRGRAKLPPLQDLSEEFLKSVPAGAGRT
jgi:2-hydroxychromene-2-carboxylate isomerase